MGHALATEITFSSGPSYDRNKWGYIIRYVEMNPEKIWLTIRIFAAPENCISKMPTIALKPQRINIIQHDTMIHFSSAT